MTHLKILENKTHNNLMIALYKNANDDKYYFYFKTKEGKAVLVSQSYTTKASAENGIESIIENAGIKDHYDVRTSPDGRHYFNLKAANGQVVGTSLAYESEKELKKVLGFFR